MPKRRPSSVNSTAALARHLGLSRWTVSRAINGHPEVNADTTQRVQVAMRELGFVPSPFGRALRGGRTRTIGVSFRELETPILVRKVTVMQKLLRERHYRPLFELIEGGSDPGLEVVRHFASMRAEGVVLVDSPVGEESAPWLEFLAQNRIPGVLLEPRGTAAHNAILLDRRAALARVTEHLYQMGHRHFGLLGIDRSFPLGVPRCEGVADALKAHGERFEDCVDTVIQSNRRFDAFDYGRELAEFLLGRPVLPTALIALNDEIATGAMWQLQRAGLVVPRDISIFGFDNQPISTQTSPRLSTVDQQVPEMIAATVEMLFELLKSPPGTELPARCVQAQVVLRDSVAPPPAAVPGYKIRRHARG
jgi:DNA-binding LacI/PurR family transcriptional regulator